MKHLFELLDSKCVQQSEGFRLEDLSCDFVESQQGVLYFMHINSYDKIEVEGYGKTWFRSEVLEKKISTEQQKMIQKSRCMAKIICAEDEHQKLCYDFVQICKREGIWQFDSLGNSEVAKAEKKDIELYNFELQIGVKQFNLVSQKAKITPFLPLTSYPDRSTADYHDFVK